MPGGILSSMGCFTYHKKGGYPSPPLRQYNSGPYAQVITSLSPFPASASKKLRFIFLHGACSHPGQGTREGHLYHGRTPLRSHSVHGRGAPRGYPAQRKIMKPTSSKRDACLLPK